MGLGETFFLPEPSKPTSMKTADRCCLAAIRWRLTRSDALSGYLGFRSTGAEMRGISAIDIALWDIFGKVDPATARPASWRLLAREDPHVQHLRRHNLHAKGHRPDGVELWGAPTSGAPTPISTASCIAPTTSPLTFSSEGSPP